MNSSKQYRIKLQWMSSADKQEHSENNNNTTRSCSEVLSIAPEMTLSQLGVKAQELMLLKKEQQEQTKIHSVSHLSASFTTQQGRRCKIELWGDDESEQKLVRDCIPNMSLVYCSSVAVAGQKDNSSTSTFSAIGCNNNYNFDKRKRSVDDSSTIKHDGGGASKKLKKIDNVIELLDSSSSDDDDDECRVAVATKIKPAYKYSSCSSQDNHHHSLKDPRKPTSVVSGSPTDFSTFWIYQPGPPTFSNNKTATLGKWLVFRPEPDINETWNRIARAVQSGCLHSCGAKVATKFNTNNQSNPNVARSSRRGNSSSYVICVYTSAELCMEVGLRLSRMVQHDITYKHDQDTMKGVYGKGASAMTLYWNNGNSPSTTRRLWTKTDALKRAQKSAREARSSSSDLSLDFAFDNVIMQVRDLKHALYKDKNNRNMSLRMENLRVMLYRNATNKIDKNAIQVRLLPPAGTVHSQNMGTNIEGVGNKSSSRLVELQQREALLGFIAKEEAQVWSPFWDRKLVQVRQASILAVDDGYETAKVKVAGVANDPHGKEMLQQCFVQE